MEPITIYIPCYNAEIYIKRSLEAILNQSYQQVAEVIVVDDGSTDQTVRRASSYPVRVISHKQNMGLAAARNTALNESKTELVASLDSDCVPSSDWLDRLAVIIEQENVAAVGGKLVEVVQNTVADRWRRNHMAQDWGEELVSNPPFMFGNNLLLKKSIVVGLGGYNEIFRTNGEDADISRRLRSAGWDTIYTPFAEVKHLRSDDFFSILGSYWSGWRFGANAYLEERASFSLRHLLSHLFGRHYTKVLAKDLLNMNIEFFPLTILLPFYMIYRDLRLVLTNTRSTS